jgi:hypothetical protein
MSRDVIERAASESGVDAEAYRAAVHTSFEVWAEITGDNRPLNELPPVQALGRVGCVAAFTTKVIDA